MNDLKKLTIVIIRLQALAIFLTALIQWGIMLTGILLSSLRAKHAEYNNEVFVISSILYLIVSITMWARSKALAGYFINGLEDEQQANDT